MRCDAMLLPNFSAFSLQLKFDKLFQWNVSSLSELLRVLNTRVGIKARNELSSVVYSVIFV